MLLRPVARRRSGAHRRRGRGLGLGEGESSSLASLAAHWLMSRRTKPIDMPIGVDGKETDKKRKAPDTTEGGEGGEGVAAVKRSYVRSGATKMCPIRVAR